MSVKDLVGALNRELSDTPLRFAAGGDSTHSPVADLACEDRFVGVFESSGSYLLSFYWKGQQQANGQALDVASAANAARRWAEGSGLESLAAAHPFVEFSRLQLARERGTALEFQWAALLDLVDNDWKSFRDLVILASDDPFLRQFFPRLGHRLALFADEFSEDMLVGVFVLYTGSFAVYDNDGEGFAFEGDAPAMVGYLVDRLHDRSRND
jgi:hypothetical protein